MVEPQPLAGSIAHFAGYQTHARICAWCAVLCDGVLLAALHCLCRVQDTGMMAQLQRVKAVFSEPRRAGDDFDTTIRRFYEAIDEGQGGLFMAVCRGKVRAGRREAQGQGEWIALLPLDRTTLLQCASRNLVQLLLLNLHSLQSSHSCPVLFSH